MRADLPLSDVGLVRLNGAESWPRLWTSRLPKPDFPHRRMYCDTMSPSDHSFVDYVKISVKAGDGGNGCLSFRKEKHTPRGGPDGGDGGKGGDVWLETEPTLATLLDIRYHPHVVADRGQHGKGKNMSGRGGEDRIILVPLGTLVSDDEGPLADLTHPGQRFLAAAGGKGGLGNQHFATPTNQAPRKHTPGVEGEERRLVLELKLIADVGLVGLPNAGKSTMLKALTHATPRIASYPFTTLHPNLGIMELDGDRRVAIADIPGLIEGASRGVGLGDRFLRHVERTAVIVHLIAPDPVVFSGDSVDADAAEVGAGSAIDAYHLIRQELGMYSFKILEKPEIVALTKIDLLPAAAIDIFLELLWAEGIEAIPVSAQTGAGMDDLKAAVARSLDEIHALESASAIQSEEPAE